MSAVCFIGDWSTVSSQAGKVGTLGAWSLGEGVDPLFNTQKPRCNVLKDDPNLTGSQEGQTHKESEARCMTQVRHHTNSLNLLRSGWEQTPYSPRSTREGRSSVEARSTKLLPNTVCSFPLSTAPLLKPSFCSLPLLPCLRPGVQICWCTGILSPRRK